MRRMLTIVFVLLLLTSGAAAGSDPAPIIVDDFERDLSEWEEKEFKGRTKYSINETEGGEKVLCARSEGMASGLVREIDFDPHQYPFLSWRWKIERTLTSGDARTKNGDDYAARVYVIFPHWIKPLTKTINYIWANRLERGEAIANSYFSGAMMLAVESGDEHAGQWLTEKRNLVEDYRRLFGEDPPQAGAVAIMTDTDNTGERTGACYDDIVLSPVN